MCPTSSVYPLRVKTQLASAILVCVAYFPRAAPLAGRRQGSPVLVDDDVHGGTPLAPSRRPQLPVSVCESAPAQPCAAPKLGGSPPPGGLLCTSVCGSRFSSPTMPLMRNAEHGRKSESNFDGSNGSRDNVGG